MAKSVIHYFNGFLQQSRTSLRNRLCAINSPESGNLVTNGARTTEHGEVVFGGGFRVLSSRWYIGRKLQRRTRGYAMYALEETKTVGNVRQDAGNRRFPTINPLSRMWLLGTLKTGGSENFRRDKKGRRARVVRDELLNKEWKGGK
jgi:hypothetical protein